MSSNNLNLNTFSNWEDSANQDYLKTSRHLGESALKSELERQERLRLLYEEKARLEARNREIRELLERGTVQATTRTGHINQPITNPTIPAPQPTPIQIPHNPVQAPAPAPNLASAPHQTQAQTQPSSNPNAPASPEQTSSNSEKAKRNGAFRKFVAPAGIVALAGAVGLIVGSKLYSPNSPNNPNNPSNQPLQSAAATESSIDDTDIDRSTDLSSIVDASIGTDTTDDALVDADNLIYDATTAAASGEISISHESITDLATYHGQFASEDGSTYNPDKKSNVSFGEALKSGISEAEMRAELNSRMVQNGQLAATYTYMQKKTTDPNFGLPGVYFENPNDLVDAIQSDSELHQQTYDYVTNLISSNDLYEDKVNGSFDNYFMDSGFETGDADTSRVEIVGCTTEEDGTKVYVVDYHWTDAEGGVHTDSFIFKEKCGGQPLDQINFTANVRQITQSQPSDPIPQYDPEPEYNDPIPERDEEPEENNDPIPEQDEEPEENNDPEPERDEDPEPEIEEEFEQEEEVSDPIPIPEPETPPESTPEPTPKNTDAEIRNAGEHVDQQPLDETVTPSTTLEEDQENFEAIAEQRRREQEAAAEAELKAAEQAEAERQAAIEAERRQAEANAEAEQRAEAERQAAAEAAERAAEAAERAAEEAAEAQRQAAEAERQAAAERAAAEQAQREANERAAAESAAAEAQAGNTAEERANDFANGNF